MVEAALRTSDRLYKDLARKLVAEMVSGTYPVGARLPAERELAVIHDVSRPTVREAIIALEVQGFVEVRIGSGAYVVRHPAEGDVVNLGMSAFELTEARLLIEGEAAALAARQIGEDDIELLEGLVDQIAAENRDPAGTDQADRNFHLAIAKATRNSGMLGAVTTLWDLRNTSAEAALLHAKARTANVKPVVEEHSAILAALRARDPEAARAAMHEHLSAVLSSLLFATEEAPSQRVRRQKNRAPARA